MLYQAGQIIARTNEGTGGIDSVAHIFRPTGFTFASEVTEITADGFPFDVAPAQVLDSAIANEKFTLTLTQTSVDDLDLEMMLDERNQVNTSISLPVSGRGTVSSGSITVTGLTSDQDVVCTVLSDTDPRRLQRILAAGTPGSGEFEVGADTLSFHSDEEGEIVAYNYLKAFTNLSMQGGTNPRSQFGIMSFSAILKGTRATKRLYVPNITRTSGANLGVQSGDPTETEYTYKATVPAGWSVPFAIWTVSA